MTRIVNVDDKGFFYRDRSSEIVESGDANHYSHEVKNAFPFASECIRNQLLYDFSNPV